MSTDTAPPSVPTGRARHGMALDLTLLVALTLALRLPAFLSFRHLTFDDGVFGASAVAMRDGGLPFRDIFSSQGPVFLPLVRLFDVVGLQSTNAPRLLALASGVAVTIGVYLIGRHTSDRLGAWVAAGLATTAGSLLWVTGPLAADGPAIAFATFAFYAALRYRDSGRLLDAALIGLFVGGALSTKLTALPVVVPVAVVLAGPIVSGIRGHGLDRNRVAGLFTAAGVALAVYTVPSLILGFADVWDQSVLYHQEAAGGRDIIANARKIISTVFDRDLPVVLFGVTAAAVGIMARRHDRPARAASTETVRAGDPLLLALWLGATVLLLLYIHPLWRPHMSGLVVPAALLVGLYRPAAKIVAILVLVSLPLQVARMNDYLLPSDYADSTQDLFAIFDDLPDGAWVISDDPGQVWRAGRRTPDDLVDTSILRVESGRITAESLTEAATDDRVCAVVVWSSVRFGSFEDLGDRLDAAGYTATGLGEHRVVYVRDDCR